MTIPLSILDSCPIYQDDTPAAALARSVKLAQRAEQLGFYRIWYTEHHNNTHIAASCPEVLAAHVGAHTSTIRLGAGGVMLPNHTPYTVAERFGTLEHLCPGRIDLGLGRAPGTDSNALNRALRRDDHAGDAFEQDVVQLQAFLSHRSPIPGVTAIPGAGTGVPLYILGSSLAGAKLAARLGLPFAFASHFAPEHLVQAANYYRSNFRPSAQLSQPYFMAGVNVLALEVESQVGKAWEQVKFDRVKRLVARGRELNDEQITQIMYSSQGQKLLSMLKYSAVGTPTQIRGYLERFSDLSTANELIISLQSIPPKHVFSSLELLASCWPAKKHLEGRK